MLFAFLDTNIYIRIMTQGKSGCEFTIFNDLRTLCEGNIIRLLVPEIILFELEKENLRISKSFKIKFSDIKKNIEKVNVWSEIKDIENNMYEFLQEAEKTKIKNWESRYSDIRTFLNSDAIIKIPFSRNIWINANRRILDSRMPKINKADQDAYIIESLVEYFRHLKDNKPILYFCSENHTDFAEELSSSEKDRSFVLHPLIQKDLPTSQYFTDLYTMLQLARGYLPLNDEEINEKYKELGNDKEIIEMSKKLESFDEEWDSWTDEHVKTLIELERLQFDRFEKQFVAEVLPTLPKEILKKREKITQRIKSLISQCHKCKSWNNKSEEKLKQWLEYVPEEMISYTSLPNLLRIEENIKRYLNIHKEMDNDFNSY